MLECDLYNLGFISEFKISIDKSHSYSLGRIKYLKIEINKKKILRTVMTQKLSSNFAFLAIEYKSCCYNPNSTTNNFAEMKTKIHNNLQITCHYYSSDTHQCNGMPDVHHNH